MGKQVFVALQLGKRVRDLVPLTGNVHVGQRPPQNADALLDACQSAYHLRSHLLGLKFLEVFFGTPQAIFEAGSHRSIARNQHRAT